uniref:Uncharacterized protein n=1 Tax=Glossina brevipalpis TaxID=37001 RepID=A0A1A9WA48_9MUSC
MTSFINKIFFKIKKKKKLEMLCKSTMFFPVALIVISHYHLASANGLESLVTIAKHDPKILLISDDLIPDNVENSPKKVLRVSTLKGSSFTEDPRISIKDSSLHNIQTFLTPPNKPKYLNSRDMRIKQSLAEDDKFLKPKLLERRKQLNFLYNRMKSDVDGDSMPVHLAPGAYPVYYVMSKSNGYFGKHTLKNFSSAKDFMKYLKTKKIENFKAKTN